MSRIEGDPWAEALAEQVTESKTKPKTRFASTNGRFIQTEDVLGQDEVDALLRGLSEDHPYATSTVNRIYLVMGVRFIEWNEVKDVIRVFSTYSEALEFSELCESYRHSYRNIDDTQDIDKREELIYTLSKIDPAGTAGSQYKRFDIVSYAY
jgi:hypothetical protein